MGGLGWTALELQGYTLKNPSLHEGYKARPASGRAVSAARSQLAVSHFQSRVKRADARCRLGQAARALRNPSAGDSARCDPPIYAQSAQSFPIGWRVPRLRRSRLSRRQQQPLGPTVQDFVGAAHESAKLSLCQKVASTRLLVILAAKVKRNRRNCAAETTGVLEFDFAAINVWKGPEFARGEIPEPVSCAAHFEASEVIEASRSDFRGETVRVGD